ncbi:MAG: hypothetical protein ACLQNE_43305 [Thermoguttaceae bacterium]
MLRTVIRLLLTGSLLMPPGICICQVAQGNGNESRGSDHWCADCCPIARCEGTKDCCGLCGCGQAFPSNERCPPNCPANKKVDHSKLAEKGPPTTGSAVAINPLVHHVDLSSGRRIHAVRFLPEPSAQPIYITLCTLVI